jgi:hypothetical protein
LPVKSGNSGDMSRYSAVGKVEPEKFVFPFIMSTPVWGAGHLGLFLNVCLPSLLADGNLPGLSPNPQNRYLIYTRPEDESELRSGPTFRLLCEIIAVEVILVREEITEPHRTMSNCHIDSVRRADEVGAAAVFLPPDCVWSKGSMVALQRIARSGKSMVHMSGIRLDRDGVVPEFADWYSNDKTVLSLNPRDLVSMGLRNLHPIALTHFWKDYDGELMPANLVWTVPNEGLLLRCFHLHPLMVKSQVPFARFRSTIDDDLALFACPDASRDYVVTDSDELLAFEMSGLSRVVGTVCPKESVEGVAAWAEVGTNGRHRQLIKNAIRLKARDIDHVAWAEAERESDGVVDTVAKINALSATKLFLRYPSVYTGRVLAVTLGRGHRGDHWAGVFTRWLVWVLTALLKLNASLYGTVFVSDGAPRIAHPYWLVRRAIVIALQRCISQVERNVVLIGADAQIAAQVATVHPNSIIRTFASGSIPDPTLVRRAGLEDVDLLVTIDVDPRGVQPSAPRQIGKRQILLRLAGDPRPIDEKSGEVVYFGGDGTRLCAYFWNRGRLFRTWAKPRSQMAKLALKAVGIFVYPFIFAGFALVYCCLNLLGLLLDVAKSDHWIKLRRNSSSLPPRVST